MEILLLVVVCVAGCIYFLYQSNQKMARDITFLRNDNQSLSQRLQETLDGYETVSDLEDEIDRLKEEEAKRREIIKSLINEPIKTFPWIAHAYADYVSVLEQKGANAILSRYNAYKSKEIVADLSYQKSKITEELKETQYRLEYITKSEKIKDFEQILEDKRVELANMTKLYNSRIADLEATKNALTQDIDQAFPYLASILSEALEIRTLNLSDYLNNKKNRAEKTATEIRDTLKSQIKEYSYRATVAEAKLAYYEATVPVLEELSEGPAVRVHAGDEDQTRNWLTREEYERLTPAERNQRALDNYKASHNKSKRQIGRDYERYVGWLYESKGYSVEYKGILAGLEDLGRDLICRKDGRTVIIQCKYWSKDKLVHEKHINQLFGTYMHYMIEMHKDGAQNGLFDVFDLARDSGCSACFWTKTSLSDTARAFANALGIEVHEHEEIGDYPMIKCNINRMTGEKIYHLPFDINYDKTVIDPAHGEFYAATVPQAESAGFRRTQTHLLI